MAILPTLGAAQIPTLANAATIGNPQGQQRQVEELARLLAGYQQAQAGLDRADQLSNQQFVPGSGALGFLAQVSGAIQGGRLRRKEGERATDYAQRILQAQREQEMSKTLEEENRKAAAERAKIAQRLEVIRRGDPNELLAYGIKTGDEPGGELVQDPMTGAYYRVRGTQAVPVQLGGGMGGPQQITGADGESVSINLDPNLSPEERASHLATIQQLEAGQTPVGRPVYLPSQGGQFRTTPKPQPDTSPKAPQGYRWEGENLVAIPGGPADPATKKATAGAKPLGVEAANKVGLYDNALRAAIEWQKLVVSPDGSYNDIAARTPEAQALLRQAIRAKLRAESGASISEQEVDGELERYGPALIAADTTNIQKANALLRDLATQKRSLVPGMQQNAGTGGGTGGKAAPSGRIRFDAQGNVIP